MTRPLLNVPPSSAALEIFAAYPRRVGKPDALRAIQRAVNVHGAEHVLTRTKEFTVAFQRSGKSLEFVPYPSTFYNQQRYEDDYAAMFPAPAPRNGHTEVVPLWQQVKATESLLETVNKALRAIPNRPQSVWPKEFEQDERKREPLRARKAELTEKLNKLKEQQAQ